MFFTRDKSFYKTLVTLAIPIALQNAVTFAVGLADNVMIGTLGDSAISGVYVGSQLQTLLQMFIGGIEGAILILAAQYWGKRDTKSIRRIAAIGVRFALLIGLVITVTAFDFGLMKKHERNAAKGDLFTTGGEEFDQVAEDEINPNGKVIDLVLPVAVLIVSAVGAMIYTGFQGGATNLITAFSGCDAETSLIFATLVTVFFMLILYLPRKVVTFKGFMDSLAEGFKLMVPAVTILIFAWSLKGMGDALGLAEFVGGIVGDNASASIFIPAILFVVAIFLSFSTGTSWGTFAILVPIATALFAGADNLTMMTISVSAVLAGAVCGDHISPISDTTVMSSAGAQSNHINHVSTQMQYAAVVATVSFVGYILAGIIRVWWIVLGISLILLIGVLMGMRMFLERKQVKKHAG